MGQEAIKKYMGSWAAAWRPWMHHLPYHLPELHPHSPALEPHGGHENTHYVPGSRLGTFHSQFLIFITQLFCKYVHLQMEVQGLDKVKGIVQDQTATKR